MICFLLYTVWFIVGLLLLFIFDDFHDEIIFRTAMAYDESLAGLFGMKAQTKFNMNIFVCIQLGLFVSYWPLTFIIFYFKHRIEKR